MTRSRIILLIEFIALGVVLASVATAAPVPAEDDARGVLVLQGAERGAPTTPFVFEGDLRDLPAPREWRPGDPIKEIPRRFYPEPGTAEPNAAPTDLGPDPLNPLQRGTLVTEDGTFTVPSRNFPGFSYTGVSPPDTVGDIGPNYYLQSVNDNVGAVVRIYDKAVPTPNLITSFTLDNLGSGACASGFGDPIILYDRFAERWLLSEFSGSGARLCVYISQTYDPVSGGWYNYQFNVPSFPDYPKYAVWPTDAGGGGGSYVVTANDGGQGTFALDRGAMLNGTPGTYQRFTVPGLSGFGFEALTPVDIDGPTPPASGAPALVIRHRDTEAHSGPPAPGDLLDLYAFEVDWVNPGNTTLTQLPGIDVAEFDSKLCGLTSFSCFPQPGTSTRLDPLREVVMFRPVYWNHGDHESVFGNFVTDVNGADLGGIRWFELRREGGDWELHQEGTYSIDSTNRWMGASAIDQSGNFAIGYSVSSSSTHPGLRYTGRLSSDAPGVLTQPETTIHAGSTSSGTNRWGDYAAMNLDPSDDCTFWFTSLDTSGSSWRTQIASFGFEACGCPEAPATPLVTAEPAGDNQIDVIWNDSPLATVIEYEVRRATHPAGPFEILAVVPDHFPGASGGPDYVFEDTDVSGGSTYYYTIVATDGLACTSEPSEVAQATATGLCTLVPVFSGVRTVETPFLETCTLELTWELGLARCGGPLVYNIYRSESPGFTPSPADLIAGGVTGTGYSDSDGLIHGTPYYYVIRAEDTAVQIEDDNTTERSGAPRGSGFAACTTGGGPSAPAPAPDGRLGTQPLRGKRVDPEATEILVTWDASSCVAPNYNLIYGDLSGVASYALDGAECGIGTSGSFSWLDPPSGDLYFLIVGTDGTSTESSWGTDSGSNERNGPDSSETCSVEVKDLSAPCP